MTLITAVSAFLFPVDALEQATDNRAGHAIEAFDIAGTFYGQRAGQAKNYIPVTQQRSGHALRLPPIC